MLVKAELKNLRIAPRKARMVTGLVRGKQVDEALASLDQVFRKASFSLKKLLESAIANAENNFKLERKDLYVSEIRVGDAQRLKRWLPRAHGRATLLLKRMSHVYVSLEERKAAQPEVEKKEAKKVKELKTK